ncbi:MAG: hypothetical protein WBG46_13145 [Nonlabens sp.]
MGKKKDQKEDFEELSEEQLEGWLKFREQLEEGRQESERSFEKSISLITTGGLALFLTVWSDISTENVLEYIGILIIGWGSLVFALLTNLISHQISASNFFKNQNEVDKIIENKSSYDDYIENSSKRRDVVECINYCSLFSTCFGIIMLVIFVSLNL